MRLDTRPTKPAAVTFGERLAQVVTRWAGSTVAFSIATVAVAIWAATGPLLRWSDTWQLVMNTASSIVTFLKVFLIQRSQNKDTLAMHLKLNEIITAMGPSSRDIVSVRIFWLFFVLSALQPVIKQRLLENARQRLLARLERQRKSRVILLIHRQETMSLLGFPLMRYIDINDSEDVIRACVMTDPEVPLARPRYGRRPAKEEGRTCPITVGSRLSCGQMSRFACPRIRQDLIGSRSADRSIRGDQDWHRTCC